MISARLNVKEVAHILSTSTFSVRRFIKDGLIPATKIGGQWRIKESDLASLLNGRESLITESL